MITFRKYAPNLTRSWDDFVTSSKNATFLFHRGYMNYHSDRFEDHSLLAYDDERLVALLPANRSEGALVSHGGLTYGGFLASPRMTTPLMLRLFDALCDYLREQGFTELIYKPIPHIYHRQPAEEDLYALFRHGAEQVRVDVSSTVPLVNRPSFSKGTKYGLSLARKVGLSVRESSDIAGFLAILNERLDERYRTRAVHSIEEMTLLVARFPDNIRLFGVLGANRMQAGALVYDCGICVHTQYMATTAEGRENGALDLVIHHLLHEVYRDRRYFDFGISTEQEGQVLNEGLIRHKEMLGGRATAYAHFQLKV